MSDETKRELDLVDELRKLADQLLEASCQLQTDMVAVKEALGGVLGCISAAIVSSSSNSKVGMTSHEFRHSGLLFAFEMLLTRTPRQIKAAVERRRAVKNAQSEEEFKKSELIGLSNGWEELDAADVVNEKEGRCVMNRLKYFAHIFLRRSQGVLPMRSLIELSHIIIAESDAAFSRMPGTGV